MDDAFASQNTIEQARFQKGILVAEATDTQEYYVTNSVINKIRPQNVLILTVFEVSVKNWAAY